MLLDILDKYAPETAYPGEFAAKVYKISRDASGEPPDMAEGHRRHVCTFATALRYVNREDGTRWEEKVVQLRRYSGAKFTAPEDTLPAGQLTAVTGLSDTYAGTGLWERSRTGQRLRAGAGHDLPGESARTALIRRRFCPSCGSWRKKNPSCVCSGKTDRSTCR